MDPRGWTRRHFLQAVGAGMFAGATVGTIGSEFFGGDIPEAWAGTPIGPTDGILVVVTLYGGNDGLNTFVPFGDGGVLHQAREHRDPGQSGAGRSTAASGSRRS